MEITISWRWFATVLTESIVYTLTEEPELAGPVGQIDTDEQTRPDVSGSVFLSGGRAIEQVHDRK